MLMAAPGTWEVLRFCFSRGGRTSLADGVAVLSAWCLTLAILLFNASFWGCCCRDLPAKVASRLVFVKSRESSSNPGGVADRE